MLHIKERIITPFESISSQNFSGFLTFCRWMKRLGWVLLFSGILFTTPRWITTFFGNSFELNFPLYFMDMYIYWFVPGLVIGASNLIAIFVSSEEKLRVLIDEHKKGEH